MTDALRCNLVSFTLVQLGLVTRAQLRSLGCDDDEIGHALRHGDLVSYRRGVFSLAGYPDSSERQQMAALLAAPDAVLSHWAAGGAHAFPRVTAGGVELTVPRARAARLRDVTAHVDPDLPSIDVTVVRGLRCTTVARTACDLAPAHHGRSLVRLVDHIERRDRVHGLQDVILCAHRLGAKRRPVLDELLVLLATRLPNTAGDCDRTAQVLRWIAAAGIHAPTDQHALTWCGQDYVCDGAWIPERTNLEVDDDWSHLTRGGIASDNRRDARAKRCGWDVVRVKPDTTEDELVADLERSLARHR